MAFLNTEEIQALDKSIDARISSLELLSLPQDIALIHLLRIYEDWNRIEIPNAPDSATRNAMSKRGQDGMHFAILWVYRFCTRISATTMLAYQANLHASAFRLFEAAIDYSLIWSSMSLIRKGKATASRKPDGSILTCFCDLHDPHIDIADTIIGGPDDPEALAIATEKPNWDIGTVMRGLDIRQVSKNKIKYSIAPQAYKYVSSEVHRLSSPKWELDPSWDIGGYTLAQFKEVWISLHSLAIINHFACLFSRVDGGALDSVVMVKNRARWIKELARYSNTPPPQVDLILRDLTFEHRLYAQGAKQPDVTYQPFFPIGEDLLCLSNWLVVLSNAERNMWDLVDIKRPELHSALRNRKEQLWIDELKPRLQSYGLKTFGPFGIEIDGVPSDVDLLAIDSANKFGIAFQLKWLTAPDSIKDVFNKDLDLKTGIRQAKDTQKWLHSAHPQLSQITGISTTDLGAYNFKTILLSHNTLGSGWLDREGIPIINDRILHWVLGAPHHRGLRALWDVALNKTYMPEKGTHYTEGDAEAEFFEFRFTAEGFRTNHTWTPEKDIHFAHSQ